MHRAAKTRPNDIAILSDNSPDSIRDLEGFVQHSQLHGSLPAFIERRSIDDVPIGRDAYVRVRQGVDVVVVQERLTSGRNRSSTITYEDLPPQARSLVKQRFLLTIADENNGLGDRLGPPRAVSS